MMASSISSPATRMDFATTIPPNEIIATSVVPPPISITISPDGSDTGNDAPNGSHWLFQQISFLEHLLGKPHPILHAFQHRNSRRYTNNNSGLSKNNFRSSALRIKCFKHSLSNIKICNAIPLTVEQQQHFLSTTNHALCIITNCKDKFF